MRPPYTPPPFSLHCGVSYTAYNIICILVYGAERKSKEKNFASAVQSSVHEKKKSSIPSSISYAFSASHPPGNGRPSCHSEPRVLPLLRLSRMRMRACQSREKSPFEAPSSNASRATPALSLYFPILLLLIKQSMCHYTAITIIEKINLETFIRIVDNCLLKYTVTYLFSRLYKTN